MEGGAEDPLKSHRRELTVVFFDLRGFTSFAETAEPEEVMSVLREYHGELGRLILEHEGTLERFAGDGMMVFFNDPVPVPIPRSVRCKLAVAAQAKTRELTDRWRKLGFELDLGIGIAQGYATIGAIGFEGRWDYGAVGTVTNLSFRLCSEAKAGTDPRVSACARGGRSASEQRASGRTVIARIAEAGADVQCRGLEDVVPEPRRGGEHGENYLDYPETAESAESA